MDTLAHADFFFMVTTVFVAILCVGSAIVLYYLIGILRDVKQISTIIKMESERINGDLEQLHGVLRQEGGKLKAIFDLLLAFGRHRRGKKTKESTTQ